MKINEAHSNLVKVLTQGRIIFNNAPLTLIEMDSLVQSANLLYDGAKENEESKASHKPVNKGKE